MLQGLITFAWGSFSGGLFGEMFQSWEQAGVFSYMLPFLLIFSLVFGILTQVKLFKDGNKAINGIIALVVSLMSIQFGIVSEFFAQVFPRVGVGLVILLVVMIFLGLFAPDRTWVTYTLFAAAAVILIVVLSNSATSVQWLSTGILSHIDWQFIMPFVVLIVLVAVVIGGSMKPKDKQDTSSLFMRNLLGTGK
ncbi:hypothetical protein KAJ87_02470 [Candidatus Pacearchaeota archaeon]|nr:hypothetical protein [Candidatus Pacearchaeota archaeon]